LIMDEYDERTKANMGVVLDAICTELSLAATMKAANSLPNS